MDCRRVRKSLMDYVDGRLSETRRGEVGRHLESCENCSALAEKLTTSASALSGLAPVKMPQEASRRVIGALKSPGKAAHAGRFFRSPRALAAAGTAALVLVALVVVGVFTLGGPGKKSQLSKSAQQSLAAGAAEKSQTSPELSVMPGTTPASVDTLVLPVANITENNYDQDSIKKMAENLEVKNKFAERYSASDVNNLRESYTRKLASDFTDLGGDGAMLEAMISYVQSAKPVLLPCYVEKAQFAGETVYIIGLCGQSRGDDSKKLTRTEFWALNPDKFESDPEASLVWWGQSIKQ